MGKLAAKVGNAVAYAIGFGGIGTWFWLAVQLIAERGGV